MSGSLNIMKRVQKCQIYALIVPINYMDIKIAHTNLRMVDVKNAIGMERHPNS